MLFDYIRFLFNPIRNGIVAWHKGEGFHIFISFAVFFFVCVWKSSCERRTYAVWHGLKRKKMKSVRGLEEDFQWQHNMLFVDMRKSNDSMEYGTTIKSNRFFFIPIFFYWAWCLVASSTVNRTTALIQCLCFFFFAFPLTIFSVRVCEYNKSSLRSDVIAMRWLI